jgi:hypothetical protein
VAAGYPPLFFVPFAANNYRQDKFGDSVITVHLRFKTPLDSVPAFLQYTSEKKNEEKNRRGIRRLITLKWKER